jgi:Cu(I)/Ag(I) efflux system membrane fusion protein
MDALGGAPAAATTTAGTTTAATWIVARVPQEAASLVAADASADFTADLAGRPTFTGTVVAAPSYVDPGSRTAPVRVRAMDHDRRLLPGMTGTVAIEVGAAHDAVVVPEVAVVYDDRRPLVFVADDHGAFSATPVVLGVIRAGRVEIREGVAAGARVATTGAASLLSASRLSTVEGD